MIFSNEAYLRELSIKVEPLSLTEYAKFSFDKLRFLGENTMLIALIFALIFFFSLTFFYCFHSYLKYKKFFSFDSKLTNKPLTIFFASISFFLATFLTILFHPINNNTKISLGDDVSNIVDHLSIYAKNPSLKLVLFFDEDNTQSPYFYNLNSLSVVHNNNASHIKANDISHILWSNTYKQINGEFADSNTSLKLAGYNNCEILLKSFSGNDVGFSSPEMHLNYPCKSISQYIYKHAVSINNKIYFKEISHKELLAYS